MFGFVQKRKCPAFICRTRYLDASAIVAGEEIYAPQEDCKEKIKESDFVVFYLRSKIFAERFFQQEDAALAMQYRILRGEGAIYCEKSTIENA